MQARLSAAGESALASSTAGGAAVAFAASPFAAALASLSQSSGLGSLALRLHRRQCLAVLLVAHSQVWLLLPQLGEQRLWAEVGVSQVQPAHGLQEGRGHATAPRGSQDSPSLRRGQSAGNRTFARFPPRSGARALDAALFSLHDPAAAHCVLHHRATAGTAHHRWPGLPEYPAADCQACRGCGPPGPGCHSRC
eukprot:scaffold23893_cov63-Phaeocystis_antarctica.AAC.3